MSRNGSGRSGAGLGVVGEDLTVGVARFMMETCTFAPRRTGIEEWEYRGPPIEGEAVLESNAYVEGFVDRCREVGGAELVGVPSPRRPKGGSSGSWVTEAAFEKYAAGITDGLESVDGLDAVYLSLHGAMAVDGVPKPETELVRRVRETVGDRPVYVTLDLHANVDGDLGDAADAVFVVKRYPHYDSRRQGERAARVLHRQLRGAYDPVVATREPGVITPSVYQGTGDSPAMEIMERARRWEDREPGAFVSVAFGFAYADVPNAGATVTVVADGDEALANEIADDVSSYIWRVRESFANASLPDTEAGVARALASAEAGNTPVVLADHADRMGDSTHVLRELMARDASRFVVATINDPEAVETLATTAEVGDRVTVDVGGHAPTHAGDPVEIDGTVEYLDGYADGRRAYDTVAVVRFGDDNRVVLTPQLHQVTSPRMLDAVGVDVDDADVLAIKSRVHFRRGFVETGVAGDVVRVDAPGLGPADLTTLDYDHVPADLYPLSEGGNGGA
jgi:microcystin degradation protein MlrC